MVHWDFELEDLTKVRFAISPMWETAAAINALRNPSLVATHLPWVKQIRPLIRHMDLTPALALLPSQGYIADFLTPPPSTPLASFADELEIVRATPTDQVLHDIQMLLDDANDPETLEPFLSDPRGEVERLADVLQIFWQRAVEPHWPRVRSLLEADLMYRSRRLTEGGLEKLFGDLHPSVVWKDRTLTLTENKCDSDGSLHGQGLLLLPSAFSSARTWAMVEAEWQPTLIYPARGVGPAVGVRRTCRARWPRQGDGSFPGRALDGPRRTQDHQRPGRAPGHDSRRRLAASRRAEGRRPRHRRAKRALRPLLP